MSSRPSFFLRAVTVLIRGVDLLRLLVVNALFFGLVLLLFVLAAGKAAPRVPPRAVLVVDPEGVIVEQLQGDETERAIAELAGTLDPETRLQDLLDALDTASGDGRIAAVLLDLDGLVGAGPSKLDELHQAITRVRATGKTVIAAADVYTRSRYYLASAADEVFLHHMGLVLLDGYGIYQTYYRDLIDRLEIDWNIFRVGEFKSAVEPYLREDMSPEARRDNLEWLGDLWRAYLERVGAARGLAPEAVQAYIDELAPRLEAHAGDAAEVAREAGLVDVVGDRDEVRRRLIELAGEDSDSHSFPRVGFRDYLEATRARRSERGSGDAVGLVVAKGIVVDGSHPPGVVGGDTVAGLLRAARHDDDVKALVVRIDSPGGSTFASEVVRRELQLVREAGKPVVVSMSSVAASGGYWIATAADEIWASPLTITGSIGIYAMFPTFQKPLDRHLGMRVDGVGTTWLSGALRPDRELPAEARDAIQLLVESGYQEFLEHVAVSRHKSLAEVDELARGRVWSGTDALDVGLVDQLGGLSDAVASAARRAGLAEGAYRLARIEPEPTLRFRFLGRLLTRAKAITGFARAPASRRDPLAAITSELQRRFGEIAQLDDPRGIYSHCFCEVR